MRTPNKLRTAKLIRLSVDRSEIPTSCNIHEYHEFTHSTLRSMEYSDVSTYK